MKHLLGVIFLLGFVSQASAQPNVPSPVNLYTFEQLLDAQVSPDLPFVDEEGHVLPIGSYFKDRPILLVLVQYRCPMLCNQVLNGLLDAVRGLPGTVGKDFDVVVVSFDPRETPELAQAKKASYVEDYGRAGSSAGWHFLTGEKDAIDKLCSTVGFRFAYSPPPIDRFAHPSGFIVLTPQGKTSKYFFGILFNQQELQQAIDRANKGEIGKSVAAYMRVLMLCYDFDPASGKYVFSVMGAVRVGGILTVCLIVSSLLLTWMRERRAYAHSQKSLSSSNSGGVA